MPANRARDTATSASWKVVKHSSYVSFQLAEVAVPCYLFRYILRLIYGLRQRPSPA